jgi:hypothetical protein
MAGGADMNKKMMMLMAGMILCLAVSGCLPFIVGAAAGAASGVVWVQGRLQKELDYPAGRVHGAAVSTVKKLGLKVTEDKSDQVSSKVQADFADGTHCWIDVEALTNKRSRITIRVGVMGNKTRSQVLLDEIERKL